MNRIITYTNFINRLSFFMNISIKIKLIIATKNICIKIQTEIQGGGIANRKISYLKKIKINIYTYEAIISNMMILG